MASDTPIYSVRSFHRRLHALNRNYLVLFVLALLLFCFIGNLLRQIEIGRDNKVQITFELKVLQPDVFYLFYMPINETEHHDSRALHAQVAGNEKVQSLTFTLPDSLLIKELRFDLGTRLSLRNVQINKIYLWYNNQHLVLFDPLNHVNGITTNEFVTHRDNTIFDLHQAANGSYDPYIYTGDISGAYRNFLGSRNTLPYPFVIAFVLTLALFIYALFFLRSAALMSVFYSLASCFFVTLLFLPSLARTFGLSESETAEKRVLAAKPEFKVTEITDFARRYEAYYSDHFAFRENLVNLGSKIRYSFFNSSAVAKAAVGKEDWFFLNGEFYKITEDLQKANLYTKEQLEKSAAEWEARKRDLDTMGISYFMAVWPDKHYIYPEYLPYCMRVLKKDTMSRCDQAITFLKNRNSTLHIIDVRQTLLEAKKERLVYEKYDSHWNSYGAYLAYRELMKELQKKFPTLLPHDLSSFNLSQEEKEGGDLSQMLGLSLKEMKPVLVLKNDSSLIELPSAEGFPERTLIYENKKASSDLTALIYRDSFTSALVPFLTPHFKKIVLIWDIPFSWEHVKKVNPNLIIECYATRYFR